MLAMASGGNLGIPDAYTMIPLALLRCIRRMPRALQPTALLIRFFAAFILSCGVTHLKVWPESIRS